MSGGCGCGCGCDPDGHHERALMMLYSSLTARAQEEDITKLQTGGPDGDLGSNEIVSPPQYDASYSVMESARFQCQFARVRLDKSAHLQGPHDLRGGRLGRRARPGRPGPRRARAPCEEARDDRTLRPLEAGPQRLQGESPRTLWPGPACVCACACTCTCYRMCRVSFRLHLRPLLLKVSILSARSGPGEGSRRAAAERRGGGERPHLPQRVPSPPLQQR